MKSTVRFLRIRVRTRLALAICAAVAAPCALAACAEDLAPPPPRQDDTLSTVVTPPAEAPLDTQRRRFHVAFSDHAARAAGDATPPPTADTASPDPTYAPSPATTVPPPVPSATAPAPQPTPAPLRAVPFRGVNLAGAEFGGTLPGTEGSDYQFPTTAEVDTFVAKGMNAFRVGFLWERLQPALYGTFDATYAARLDALVAHATSRGARVIVNPHNFARYRGQLVGSSAVPNAAFADFWKRLSGRYAANAGVMFNLVNEPNTMPTEQWVAAANAAIAAIRSAGAHQTIIAPGNGWTGGASWADTWYGTSNAVAMLAITDPDDAIWFEAHQYLDASAGGTDTTCVSATAGRERLAPFVAWLRANKKKGFIGEFAGGNNATCKAAISDMLGYMNAQTDVLMGWLWWAAGPAWGDYPFTLEPKKTVSGTVDSPFMAWLTPYL
jgi:endoglucanase